MLPNTSTLNLGKILTGISKSLNIAKEVIPIYEEFKPMIGKIKNVTSSLKTITNSPKEEKIIKNKNTSNINNIKSVNNPTFFA